MFLQSLPLKKGDVQKTEGFLCSPFKKGRCLERQRDLFLPQKIPPNPPLIKGETRKQNPPLIKGETELI